MPKTVVRDVFGELLETDKQTVKAGGKAAGDVAKQRPKRFWARDKLEASGLRRRLRPLTEWKACVSKGSSNSKGSRERKRRERSRSKS